MRLPVSVLDLVPVGSGSTATEALRHSLELAQFADRAGFTRYWFAEHHGMPSIASSVPEILIARTAAATERIRVGSGGIMMQNHVPLKLAEAFHTLEALYPGRVDLGGRRTIKKDPTTSRALRPFSPAQFTEQLNEMTGMSGATLGGDHPFKSVRVVPAGVELPPIWLLGSSGASAGLGYSFASHFSPAPAAPALDAYRAAFRPSARFPQPHTILAVAAICADSEEEADHLAYTTDLVWVRLQRGEFGPLPSPEEGRAHSFTPQERAVADNYRRLQFIGTPESVSGRIRRAAEEAGADEILISSMIHSPAARIRSFELLAKSFELHNG